MELVKLTNGALALWERDKESYAHEPNPPATWKITYFMAIFNSDHDGYKSAPCSVSGVVSPRPTLDASERCYKLSFTRDNGV